MNRRLVKDKIINYYTNKINLYGATYKGVDWNSLKSQQKRFEQLLKICQTSSKFSLNDLGCGYGALFEYMLKRNSNCTYIGYDLSTAMINKATERYSDYPNCKFLIGDKLIKSDYTVASGIFNVKMDINIDLWVKYVYETINLMNKASIKGFSFNALTTYNDKKLTRKDLYYLDPCEIFDYCKRKISKNVSLLHDYGLYEFTILVRKSI